MKKVYKDSQEQEQREHKVFKEFKVQQEHKVLQVHKEKLVLQVIKVIPVMLPAGLFQVLPR